MLRQIKRTKSPLTYPNDRPLAASLLTSTIPEGVTKVVTPFLGGGSLQISLAQKGYDTLAYTEYRLLYDFWKCVMQDPVRGYEMAKAFHPVEDNRTFMMLQKKVYQPHDEYLRSALFYVLNLCSEHGATTSGDMEPGTPRFTKLRLDSLANFEIRPFELEMGNYKKALETTDYLVCEMPNYIPPMILGAVVVPERPQISHKKFRRMIEQSNCSGFSLVYRYCEEVMELYKDFDITLLNEGYRPTQTTAKAYEVLIRGS